MKKGRIHITILYSSLFCMLLIGQFAESLNVPLIIATGIRLVLFLILCIDYFCLWQMHLLSLPKGFWKWMTLGLFSYLFFIIAQGEWEASPIKILSGLVDTQRALIFLLPVIIVPLPNKQYFKWILRISFYFSILVIPLWVLNTEKLVLIGDAKSYSSESVGMYMPFFSALLLPLRGVLSNRERVINFLIYFIYFILMLVNARRNVCFSFALFTVISFFTISHSFVKHKVISRKMVLLLVVCLSVSGAMMVKPLLNGPFAFLKERIKEDTRSGVEAFFVADMMSSPASDWLFGRGQDGGYFQIVPNFDSGEVSDNRKIIETGYLNLVLKGGVVLVVFVMIFLLSSVCRLFKCGTSTSRYFAWVLLVYVIDLYTTNPVCIFSPRSMIFWILVSISFGNSKTKRKRNHFISVRRKNLQDGFIN